MIVVYSCCIEYLFYQIDSDCRRSNLSPEPEIIAPISQTEFGNLGKSDECVSDEKAGNLLLLGGGSDSRTLRQEKRNLQSESDNFILSLKFDTSAANVEATHNLYHNLTQRFT